MSISSTAGGQDTKRSSYAGISRLFLEQITVIDCGILDRNRGLVGCSWIVDAALDGEVDGQGMILDFGPAKRLLKQGIDRLADHRLLVPAGAPGLEMQVGPKQAELRFEDEAGGRLYHRGPRDAICALDAQTADPAAVVQLLEGALAQAMPANVGRLSLTLREETAQGAYYRYCHGLKHHDGHCQRIGHGHRSRLQIWVDGARSPDHEQRWAARWRDVFLGNRADLLGNPAAPRYRFAYQSAEGAFELELDANRCELFDGDTTVENIANFIAGQLKREQPGGSFRVRAYEGVNKGAEAWI